MDEDYKKILESMRELPLLDRCSNLTLMFLGETLNLLIAAGDQSRVIELKQHIDMMFIEFGKAITNASANSN